MLDYIKGIVFVIVFIGFLGILGKKIKKSELFSENLIYGFVVYTCFQFVGGFLAQQFRLPWLYYQIYMIVMLIGLMIFSLYKNVPKVNKTAICTHFKRYGILYLIAIVFVMLAVLNIQYLWNANNVDDGYYLNKIRMAPYLKNYTDYNFAVGIPAHGSIIRNINTFELDAAFYSHVLGIDASIYAKVFLAFFNYVFVLNVIYLFYTKILGAENKIKRLELSLIPILFYGIYYGIQQNYGLLELNDSWQNSSAMWYGSTLVKTTGIFLLLLPIFNKDRFSKKEILFYIGICLSLFSKASQTMPLVVIIIVIYVIKWLFCYLKRKINLKLALFAVIIIFIGLVALPLTPDIKTRANIVSDLLSNNMSIIIRLSLFVIVLSYTLPYPLLKKWNTWLLTIGFFMFVPRVNTFFLYSSMYDFVASRTLEVYLFTFLMTASLILFLGAIKFIKSGRIIVLAYGAMAACLIAIPIASIHNNLGIKHTFKILENNPNLIPHSTLELGYKLEKLGKESKSKLNVLMPMWLVVDGTPHALASSVRYNAFNIVSVGSVVRFNEQMDNSIYKGFDQNIMDVFEKYHSGEDRDDKKMKKLLDDYPINCVVVYYDEVAERFEKDFGFTLKGKVLVSDKKHSYYILYKN